MMAISQLSHVYLVQYDQYFPCFSYFALIWPIFWKNTHTGQYINMDSFTLWKWKTTWIRSLVSTLTWTPLLCGNGKRPGSDHLLIEQRKYVKNLPKELQLIKKSASWNGYPKNIVNAFIKRVLSKETSKNDVISNKEKDKIPTVFIDIDYTLEKKGEHLLKKSVFNQLTIFYMSVKLSIFKYRSKYLQIWNDTEVSISW